MNADDLDSDSQFANVSPSSSVNCKAVCGVPKPNKNHALVMARFAQAAMIRFREVLKQLELKLGPDTVGKQYNRTTTLHTYCAPF